MAVSEAQQKAVNKYVKNNYDRINVTFPKGKKTIIQSHVSSTGESVNAFINRAVAETMQRDNLTAAEPESTLDQDPLPDAEAQHVPNNAGLPEYLTPDVIARIDAKRFLSGDTAYQFEIGSVIGMDHISDLGDYLRQQEKNSKGE